MRRGMETEAERFAKIKKRQRFSHTHEYYLNPLFDWINYFDSNQWQNAQEFLPYAQEREMIYTYLLWMTLAIWKQRM